MLKHKIEGTITALGDLAGRVGHEEWEQIRAVRRVLLGVADACGELESRPAPAPVEIPRAARGYYARGVR